MSRHPSSSPPPTPSSSWFVVDSDERTVGPMTDFELREGLLVRRWSDQAKVGLSASGPWTAANDVRKQYLNLVERGWYVLTEGDQKVIGPFTAEKMRRLAESNELGSAQVRSGRKGSWQKPESFSSWDIPRPRSVPTESSGQPIQSKVLCPHCWHEFTPDQVRWIASHTSQRGDKVIGPEAMHRFAATNFNVDGDAIDAGEEACTGLACPRCHLEIPRAVIELQPTFISVVGAPGSGKSYFLATAVEALQRRMPESNMMFRDAQVALNGVLSGYRRMLFWSDQPDSPIALPKTEPRGDLYQSVHLKDRDIWYPKPFMFRWLPSVDHRLFASRSTVGRVVCLYDNAGEHFLPGSIRSDNFATDHLRRSNALLYLFDPTQHAPLRPGLRVISDDPQLSTRGGNYSQSEILDEVLERVRQGRGVAGVDRIKAPLIVAVTKMDVWQESLGGEPLPEDLELIDKSGRPSLDMSLVESVSNRVREWLRVNCPDVIDAAESQVEQVFYIPTSSQGTSPELNESSQLLMVKPSDIAPRMADAPLLLALHFAAPRLLPSAKG